MFITIIKLGFGKEAFLLIKPIENQPKFVSNNQVLKEIEQ